METIKCPNCGSEKVQGLTEEKYVCLACDNVFLVHNLSKEFRQTDEHISDIHADLKKEIQQLKDVNTVDEQALLENAEEHLKKESYETAFNLYDKITDEFPSHSAGWYGLYRTITRDLTFVENYAEYLCGGDYLDNTDDAEHHMFWGAPEVKNAINCEDADCEKITIKVAEFLKQCAEYGKKRAENDIVEFTELFNECHAERAEKNKIAKRGASGDKIKALLPAFAILGLILILTAYIMAADWLGKIIGVVGIGLILKFGGRSILRSFSKMKEEGIAWKESFSEVVEELNENMDTAVDALILSCTDLDNYNLILKDMEENTFMDKYLSGNYEGLKDGDSITEDREAFVFSFLDGKYEKYNYLVNEQQNSFKEQTASTSDKIAGMVGKLGAQAGNVQKFLQNESGKQTKDVISGSFCPMCGTPYDETMQFCGKCGHKF